MGIWTKFDRQKDVCYTSMITGNPSIEPWLRGFELFCNAVEHYREDRKNITLEWLEEKTDWTHDLWGWLDDFLGELAIHGNYTELLKVIDYLLKTFQWASGDDLDLKFQKAECLWNTGKEKEAYEFCRKWKNLKKNNYQADAAFIYACIHMKLFDEAEKAVKETTYAEGKCTDDSAVVYYAAQSLYEKMGDKKKLSEIKNELERYEQEVEQEMMEGSWDDDYELPFN